MNNNATKMSGHTPTPWMQVMLHPEIILGKGQISSERIEIVTDATKGSTEQNIANATFIVRCCNICDLSDTELDGIQAQGGLKSMLNKLTGELFALNAVAEAANYLESTICGYNTIFSQFEKRGEMPALKRFMEALAALAKLREEKR